MSFEIEATATASIECPHCGHTLTITGELGETISSVSSRLEETALNEGWQFGSNDDDLYWEEYGTVFHQLCPGCCKEQADSKLRQTWNSVKPQPNGDPVAFRLGSHPLIYTPGIVNAAKAHASTDRAYFQYVLLNGFPTLTERALDNLFSGDYKVEDDTVIVEG